MQPHDTISFLGLPEFKVIPMIETDDYFYIRIKQPIKDLQIRGKSIMLVLIKRRFRCSCCDKVFGETYETIDRYQRMTKRLITHIIKEATHSTFKAAAKNNGVSCYTARSLFVNTAKQLSIDKQAPRVLAMDEFAVKKGKGDNKYNLAIAVPTEHRLFDILPDRRQATVEAYLGSLLNKNQ
jgi:transposase